MATYAKARTDFEYLESIRELDDQVSLDSRRLELMKNPTKKYAKDMYESGIRLWFSEFRFRPIKDVPDRVFQIQGDHP